MKNEAMSDLIPTVSASKAELLNDLLKLKDKCRSNQKIINTQQQLINESHKELSRCTTQNQELLKELDYLKASSQQKYKLLQQQHATLTTVVHNVKSQCDEQYAEEESKLVERKNYLALCKESIALEQEMSEAEHVHNETDSILMFKDHISDLKTQMCNLKNLLQTQVVKNEDLHTKFKSTQAEVKSLQEKCQHNKDALNEATTLKETLEVDLMALKAESCALNNKLQVQEQKTNSLFDEVNENRAVIYSNVKKMHDNYLEMKQRRTDIMQQVENLQHNKAELKYKCEETKEDSAFDEFVIQYTYKDFIAVFDYLDKELDKLIAERTSLQNKSITPKEIDWFFKILDKLTDNNRVLGEKVARDKHTNSNFKFRIAQQRNEIESLQQKFIEKQNINDQFRAVINVVQESEVNDQIVCICSLQKPEE